jgi:hypothetical protein
MEDLWQIDQHTLSIRELSKGAQDKQRVLSRTYTNAFEIQAYYS